MKSSLNSSRRMNVFSRRPPRIFISSVTSEYDQLRAAIAAVLKSYGFVPVYQQGWGLRAGALLPFLRRTIKTCDAVIHLAGYRFGEPLPTSFWRRRLRSFSEWEVRYGRRGGRHVYLLVQTTDPPPQQFIESDPDRKAAQERHRSWCLNATRFNYQFQEPQHVLDLITTLQTQFSRSGSRPIRFLRWIRGLAPGLLVIAALVYLSGSLLGLWFLREARKMSSEQPIPAEVHATNAAQLFNWFELGNAKRQLEAVKLSADLLRRTDRRNDALEKYQFVLARIDEMREPARAAGIYEGLGDCYDGSGDLKNARAAFENQLRLSHSAYSPGHTAILFAMSHLARNSMKQGSYDDARQTADDVLKLLKDYSASNGSGDTSAWKEEARVRALVANTYWELASIRFRQMGDLVGDEIRTRKPALFKESLGRLHAASKEYDTVVALYRSHDDTTSRGYCDALANHALVWELVMRVNLVSGHEVKGDIATGLIQAANGAILGARKAQEIARGSVLPIDPLHGHYWMVQSNVAHVAGLVAKAAGDSDGAGLFLDDAIRYAAFARERWLALPRDAYLRVQEASHTASVIARERGRMLIERGFLHMAYPSYADSNRYAEEALEYVEQKLGGTHRDLNAFRQQASWVKADMKVVPRAVEAAQNALAVYKGHIDGTTEHILKALEDLAQCCQELDLSKNEAYYLRQAYVIALRLSADQPKLASRVDAFRRGLRELGIRQNELPYWDGEILKISGGGEPAEVRLNGELLTFPMSRGPGSAASVQ